MRPVNRVSPAVIAAFVASVVILVGFIAFLLNASRSQQAAPGNVNVTVGGPTPTTLVVNVSGPTAVPTVAPPPTVTSAPLATLPPEPTAVPTRTPLPPPPTAVPPPTRVAAAGPPQAQVEPPTAAPGQAESPAAAGQQQQPPPPPAGQTAPQPPAVATPPAPSNQPGPPQPVAGQPPVNQPPNPAAPPTPTPPAPGPGAQPKVAPPAQPTAPQAAAANPSPRGGIGNTRQDLVATYGQPVGRSPDGLEVFQTTTAEIQVAFDQDRAARLRFVLRNDRAVPLDEARNLARGLLPGDAAPTASSGEQAGRPVDQFRSVALGEAVPRSGGNLTVRYIPAASGKFSGFELMVG